MLNEQDRTDYDYRNNLHIRHLPQSQPSLPEHNIKLHHEYVEYLCEAPLHEYLLNQLQFLSQK